MARLARDGQHATVARGIIAHDSEWLCGGHKSSASLSAFVAVVLTVSARIIKLAAGPSPVAPHALGGAAARRALSGVAHSGQP